MVHVAVIAITYRRPEGLLKLLHSLQRQRNISGMLSFKITVIVVDNDAERSAEATVNSFKEVKNFSVKYIVEPAQGIPLARNAGMDAVPSDALFFCFIDDDEWAGDTWVAELLAAQNATGASCVHSGVIPVYPENPPRWLTRSKVFDSWSFSDGTWLRAAASNNVMVSTNFVRNAGLRFEERMRMTGGSDYLFFKQAVDHGLKIVWASKASVYEDIPRSRMTFRWIMQRQYRLGNTFSVSARISGNRPALAKWFAIGFLRLSLGVVMLPSLLVSPYYGMRAIVHLLRGTGIIAGVCGHSHQEYSSKGIAKDRPPAIG